MPPLLFLAPKIVSCFASGVHLDTKQCLLSQKSPIKSILVIVAGSFRVKGEKCPPVVFGT